MALRADSWGAAWSEGLMPTGPKKWGQSSAASMPTTFPTPCEQPWLAGRGFLPTSQGAP